MDRLEQAQQGVCPARATRGVFAWGGALGGDSAFTLIEVLVGAAVLSVALLAMAAMFPFGYTNINEAGKTTMAITGARQVLEEISTLPFDRIENLNGFDSQNPATLPSAVWCIECPGGEPELTVARRLRYALAGEGDGFTFTAQEKADWSTLSTGGGVTLNGRGIITVVRPCTTAPTNPCPPNPLSLTVRQVTITITFPGRSPGVQLVTNITRL